MKKTVSLILAFVMAFSCFGILAAAEENSYQPDYDTETPVVVLHGIGQNDTYILDEDGNRMLDSEGGYVTGWPLEINVGGLIANVLPNLFFSILTRRDNGLSDAMKDGAYDFLYAIHKDNEGNYLNDVEVPCYECPMSDMPEEVSDRIYDMIPLRRCGEIIGENNLYYFGYDSLGDIQATTDRLHKYITEVVLPQTGAEKVNICPISLGGTVAVNYIDKYPEDHSLIKKIVYVVPAVDGSDIVGDVLTGNLSIYDEETLYENLLVTLMGDTFTTYMLNIVLRILPTDVLQQALQGLCEGAVEAAIRNTTQLWALCPTKYYEQARAKWLSDDEHTVIREKVDAFMQARADLEENTNSIIEKGGKIYDIVCYDLELFPLSADYRATNSDGIIQSESTSMGATFADLGTTFGEGYTAAGTYCSNPAHNHLSPDGMVDPTTGLLPCTTWYFKGQSHEGLAHNDVVLNLATELMTDENMIDVYSNPVAYPQFNGARSMRALNNNLATWKAADKSLYTEEQIAEIEGAFAYMNELKKETVIDSAEWKNAELALDNALVSASVKESDEPGSFEALITKLFKCLNKGVNDVM
ncbi:MAG: hypothetical protein E7544_02815 [Ruminococcaceae bacterium]|nr:hypothetical protein [Oscillospiraceae bacterium]